MHSQTASSLVTASCMIAYPNKNQKGDNTMAMIPCPHCGQTISDRAKRCVHCGNVLIEDVNPKKFCVECGKQISIDAEECPFCGCPAEPIMSEIPVVAAATPEKKNQKPILIASAIIAFILAILLLANSAGPALTQHEQLAYQNATTMKRMMRDPDSFKLYDEMFLIEKLDENGNVQYTYTIFTYGGTNGYGAMTTAQAIFRDGEYLMDYGDDLDPNDPNFDDMLTASGDLLMYTFPGKGDQYRTININIDKIKTKMGLK